MSMSLEKCIDYLRKVICISIVCSKSVSLVYGQAYRLYFYLIKKKFPVEFVYDMLEVNITSVLGSLFSLDLSFAWS